MTKRRKVLAYLGMLGAGALISFFSGVPRVLAMAAEKIKRILPKGTDPGSLASENPARIDTRNLEVMPLDDFGTMGDETAPYNPAAWRLEVAGSAVKTPLTLDFAGVRELPSVEKDVLLICPGFFSNYGRWKGVRVSHLMQMTSLQAQPTNVHIIGLSGARERRETFSIKEIQTEGMLLAYRVNGQPLPEKHGFPLRLVAEGHMGSSWVKYVKRVEFS